MWPYSLISENGAVFLNWAFAGFVNERTLETSRPAGERERSSPRAVRRRKRRSCAGAWGEWDSEWSLRHMIQVLWGAILNATIEPDSLRDLLARSRRLAAAER